MGSDVKPLDTSIGVFSDDQLARVQQAFALERMLVLPFFSMNRSILDLRRRTETARKALIETEHGVLFLKELPWYCSTMEFARYQTGLLLSLATTCAPVARPRVASSGEYFFYDGLTGSIFTLQPFIEGSSWTASNGESKAAGVALARLHQCSARTGVVAGAPGTLDVFSSARNLVSLLLEGGGGTHGMSSDVRKFVAVAFEAIECARVDAYSAGYGANAIAIHGDFNPFNLIFDADADVGSEVVGIVDFDNSCIDDPAHDLGEALIRFGWINYRGLSSAYGAVPTQFNRASVESVISGYRDVDASAAECMRPMLPAVMTAVGIELAAIGVLSSYYSDADLAVLSSNARKLHRLSSEVVSAVW